MSRKESSTHRRCSRKFAKKKMPLPRIIVADLRRPLFPSTKVPLSSAKSRRSHFRTRFVDIDSVFRSPFPDFRRRCRPQSLTLSTSPGCRERRNSAPHLVDAVSRNGVVLQRQQGQLPHHPFMSKAAQLQMHQMHGSLGDLSPQTLIKTKAIRKIHGGTDLWKSGAV